MIVGIITFLFDVAITVAVFVWAHWCFKNGSPWAGTALDVVGGGLVAGNIMLFKKARTTMGIYRIVVTGDPEVAATGVVFLDTHDTTPADDYCLPGDVVISDSVHACDLPDSFPVNDSLTVDTL